MTELKCLLIANRGEIALRIATTARRMGLRTVAVYSEADRDAAFVREADQAVCIGPAPASGSYLNMQAVLEAARRTGADALHPGYGFLSENAEFADACAQAGLIFVGPPASAIAAMGSKAAAKQLMQQAGVPLVPGYHGDDQTPDFLQAQADLIGYPVLIKATAGGGGKGMRIVRQSADFAAALASCQREARNAFSDDRVLIERYLDSARHVEVQVFADTHGQVVHLFERDCSVQRRHQKVLEEAPAPGLDEQTRQALGAAAVNAARAVGYVGAGTVEFIMEPDGRFYFMEMNTRLQVEHPVTEMITGLDLVALQLRIARGEPLPFDQDGVKRRGHAMELRLYAENPEQGFLPSMGRLHHVHWPTAIAFRVNDQIDGDSIHYGGTPAALRLDAAVGSGDEVTAYYDPMIGKLIAWGPDRLAAIDRLLAGLAQLRVVGVHTNTQFLRRLLADAAFREAKLDTAFIQRRHESLLGELPTPAVVWAMAAAIIDAHQVRCHAPSTPASAWQDPWSTLTDWRLSGAVVRTKRLRHASETRLVNAPVAGASVSLSTDPSSGLLMATAQLEQDGQRETADAVLLDHALHVFSRWGHHVFEHVIDAADGSDSQASGGGLLAPMPGRILSVLVKAGETVAAGQALLVMEAMKMEHTIVAPVAGVVAGLPYAVGDQVAEGVKLLELQAS